MSGASSCPLIGFEIDYPARIILVGSSFCGKSSTILEFISNRDLIFKPKVEKVYYFYSQPDKKYVEFQELHPEVEFFQDYNSAEKLIGQTKSSIFVFDDYINILSTDSKFRNFINDFFVKISSHTNSSVIITIHNLFADNLRLLRLNATHLLLYKNLQDISSIKRLASQVVPNKSNNFVDCYLDATSAPYGYLCLWFSGVQLRLTNFLLPNSNGIVYNV
jgi:hypothetical protein